MNYLFTLVCCFLVNRQWTIPCFDLSKAMFKGFDINGKFMHIMHINPALFTGIIRPWQLFWK